MKWGEELEKTIASLIPNQIVTTLRKHIDPAKITMVKAGDFDKGKNTEPSKAATGNKTDGNK
jgi:zinc protease